MEKKITMQKISRPNSFLDLESNKHIVRNTVNSSPVRMFLKNAMKNIHDKAEAIDKIAIRVKISLGVDSNKNDFLI